MSANTPGPLRSSLLKDAAPNGEPAGRLAPPRPHAPTLPTLGVPERSTPARGPQAAPPAPAKAAADGCPRCGKKLVDPAGLGWCQGCGYCHTLGADKEPQPSKPQESAAPRPSPLGVVEMGQMAAGLPAWFWMLVLGVAAVCVVSLAPAYYYRMAVPQRALWATLQIGVGMLMIFIAQLAALILVGPEDEKLGAKDLIMSGNLWKMTLGRLPRTRRPVCLGAWGLTAVLAAVFLVGGLTHWLDYLPGGPKNKNPTSTRSAR